MNKFRIALLLTLTGCLWSVSTAAFAQAPAASPAVKAEKVEDFGLRNRLVSDQHAKKLNFSKAQAERFKKLQADSKKEIEKLTEEGKNISHAHAPGEPCPGCAHAAKVRKAYSKYFLSLGEILTAAQEKTLAKLVAQEDAAQKRSQASTRG